MMVDVRQGSAAQLMFRITDQAQVNSQALYN